MEIETKTENKNKEQRKNKLGSMSFIKCVPKAKKNKRKFTLFRPQIGPKNKTSFVQKRATNNLQLFTIGKHTQNSLVFPLTNKTTKSTKPTMTTQQRYSACFQDPDYQHSTIGKAFSALKIPWNTFGESGHGYKDLDFLDYAFHANQIVNDKVTP